MEPSSLPGRTKRSLVLLLGVLTLLPILPATAQETEPETEIIWKAFQADRSELLNDLAVAFVDCFQRHDSAIDPLSPIFHGCIDWHSAVHAAYSHHMLYRRTGSHAYLELAEHQISPQGVSLIPAEQVYEQAKAPDFPLTENPYGFGWFLILARERELATGKNDFRPMADFAAQQMITWFQTRATNNDANTFIMNTAHPNYSWSLINLDVWGRYTNNQAILDAVRQASVPLLAPSLDNSCRVTRDQNTSSPAGFQPACLMRLAAVAHIWGEHVSSWVRDRIPVGYHIDPITSPPGCHQGGLNFTRAFALYQMYLATGDTSFRDNYIELIRYHVSRPDLYIGPDYLGDPDYLCYSHWVAQVGVRAISLSYEERPPTPEQTPPGLPS
ncbi:MAG: DUF2891 family protein [Actinomycetota bacterium]